MSDDNGLLHAEAVEEAARVRREEIEAVANVRLRGLPEADLIGHDDAKALTCELADRPLPRVAVEVLPVQEDDRLSVSDSGGTHIHVGHAHHLSFDLQREELDGKRIWRSEARR